MNPLIIPFTLVPGFHQQIAQLVPDCVCLVESIRWDGPFFLTRIRNGATDVVRQWQTWEQEHIRERVAEERGFMPSPLALRFKAEPGRTLLFDFVAVAPPAVLCHGRLRVTPAPWRTEHDPNFDATR